MQHSSETQGQASTPDERAHAKGSIGICARCTQSGDLGLAILSPAMAAGGLLGTVRHGTAAVISQGDPNPYLKFWVLGSMLAGKSLPLAIKEALARDPDEAFRQVLAVSADGTPGGHTGGESPFWSGHVMGPDFCVGGTRLTVDTVAQAMAETFIASKGQSMPLGERMLHCLEVGQAAGGTAETDRSAVLTIGGKDGYQKIDLRVDDHDAPLQRLQTLHTDYLKDDALVDKFLATQELPQGRLPNQFEETFIYLRRYWLDWQIRLGLRSRGTKSQSDRK